MRSTASAPSTTSTVPAPSPQGRPERTLLDVRGQSCPLPVVKISLAFRTLPRGAEVEVLATDRGAISDVPSWAKTTGNDLLEQGEADGVLRFVLRKA